MDRIELAATRNAYARAADFEEAMLARMAPDATGRKEREELAASLRRISEDAERELRK